MNEKANSVINTVPAAKALHHVPQFDPLKLLRKTTSRKTGEKVLKLDLSHKKTWFLLVHPRGRMLTNILRVTDQMAIFEAQLYADRDDPTVLAQFTSCHTRSESGPQYIRNAQDDALNEALDNAGFGIQLSDLVEPSGNGYGSEVLLSQVEALLREPERVAPTTQPVPVQPAAPVPPVPVQTVTVQTPPTNPVQVQAPAPQVEVPAPAREEPRPPVQTVTEAPVSNPVEAAAPVVQTAPIEVVEPPQMTAIPDVPVSAYEAEPVAEVPGEYAEEIPGEPAAEPQPSEPATNASVETANILQMLGGIPAAAAEAATEPAAEPKQAERPTVVPFPHAEGSVHAAPVLQSEVPAAAKPVVETAASYTEDMTVDEIRARMTSEQAKALTVSFGPNKGWTLGQVLERRPSSLKFYALVSTDASNALKAGSFLLLDEMKQARAG